MRKLSIMNCSPKIVVVVVVKREACADPEKGNKAWLSATAVAAEALRPCSATKVAEMGRGG